jgi:copper chaperone NosL
MQACCKWLLLVCLLNGCSAQEATGPVEVRWDRETCTRCAMAVSDRHSSAQVRGAPAGESTRVFVFDDIGCALIWLDGQPWKDDARTEIWVTDQLTGHWLDARTATFIPGKRSSMGFDLGAQSEASPEGMDLSIARQYIYDIEAREHVHGGRHQGPGESGTP